MVGSNSTKKTFLYEPTVDINAKSDYPQVSEPIQLTIIIAAVDVLVLGSIKENGGEAKKYPQYKIFKLTICSLAMYTVPFLYVADHGYLSYNAKEISF